MVQNLSYDELQKMNQATIKILTIFLAEVARNTNSKLRMTRILTGFIAAPSIAS